MTKVMERQATSLMTMREAIDQSVDTLCAHRRMGLRKADCEYVTSMIREIIKLTGATKENLPKNLKILLEGVAQRERTKDPILFEVGSLIDTLSRAV